MTFLEGGREIEFYITKKINTQITTKIGAGIARRGKEKLFVAQKLNKPLTLKVQGGHARVHFIYKMATVFKYPPPPGKTDN